MSAAEKLRALKLGVGDEWDGDVTTLWLALPQIVAVIEAAEAAQQTETVSELDEDDYTVWYERPVDARDQLSAALTALDQALGDVT